MKSFFAKTTFLLSLFLLLAAGIVYAEELYIVEVDRLNLREKPDLESRIVKPLSKGEVVKVLGKKNGWLKVRSDVSEGYLLNRKRYVRPLSSIEESQRKRSSIDEEIKKEKKNVEAFKKKERDTVSELDRIDRTLQSMNKKLDAIQKDHQNLTQKRKELLDARAGLERESQGKKQLIAKRLVALYKLEATGHTAFFAEAQSVYDFAVQRKALQEILNLDDRILGEQTARIKEIGLLSEKVKKEESQIAATAQREANQLKLQAAEKRKREELLAHVHNQQKKGLSNLSSLEKAAKHLDETIDRLVKEEIARAQAEKERLAREQAERERLAKAKAEQEAKERLARGQKKPATTKPDTPTVASVPDTSSKPSVSAPPSTATGGGFAAYRGKLDMPVAGRIVSRFGQQQSSDMGIKIFSKGMGIAAKSGEPIRALFSGTVIYSDWLSAYGNMMILDHGNQYYSVYAHAKTLLKKTGTRVARNEVIARVGDTGSMNGPMLYFEIRQRGKAINPEPWLKKS